MGILGAVGSLYTAILVLLLIVGFGLVGLKFINYILAFDINIKSNRTEVNKAETYKWLRIALYSFLGVMVSILVLSLLNSSGSITSHM
jgi:hypothetical protein